jgi:hypothetical protein
LQFSPLLGIGVATAYSGRPESGYPVRDTAIRIVNFSASSET